MKHFFIFLLISFPAFANAQVEKKNFKVMSYNVENYFDYVDDSLKADEEYLPTGIRAWNIEKYRTKQNHISKVIAAVGGWEPPALVALCEIESEKCMVDLTKYSPLKNLKYKYVHYESPDARGVDVALLYQPEMFKPFHSEPIRINFPNSDSKTRDILYVAGKIPTGDTLNVFVCHFPSRLGGELESEEKRMFVALTLRAKVDSVFTSSPLANILIMGDFNDYPSNVSIEKTLKASKLTDNISSSALYNLAFALQEKGIGSHKHEAEWGMLDQIIVSGNLLNPANKISTTQSDMHVFSADFLLEDDEKFLGKKAFRTYNGMKYQGGFADHLPVYVDLWW
ncbi:Endonuclease/exonuclease/phosphatase [uncultured Paludibacter sp.]|nr:Endonuclease/exonuclease/phosphatase [uncultured Paludibacter sp.]